MSAGAGSGHAAPVGARNGGAVVPGSDIGGFNLLPWRQGAMRRLRRRRALEWLAALIVGGACGSAAAGWQLLDRTRAETAREAVEQQLARLDAPLTLARKLAREADERRAARAEAQQRARPLAHVFALIEALSQARTAGVVLEQLAQRAEETELQASAADEAAAAAWLARLHALPGIAAVNVRELKRAQEGALARERAARSAPIRVAVRLAWQGAAADAGGATRGVVVKGAK
ncbi:fimbrial assembly protein [Paraburkholderia pallida]|uniref:Fimbrial assembly protein n=1 Tax=Paraburkholderia pallida TaxID=2547399 RepID=A0A4P7CLG3_9BURK|nr:fimbrial assembly protein [Paraburkholderia pallida]QBQ96508.1 fimbrial assembly protein [Paraburkholderia pallida]